MNILDLMNKLTALSQPVNEEKETASTHKGGTTTSDEKGTTHKGKYGSEYQGDSDDDELDDKGKKKVKKAAPADGEKRKRGRPAKGADNAGKVTKPDWSAFGVKKDAKLKPWDKKATTKHSLKDWIENLDKALNEDGQMTATPMPGATAIKDATGKQVATASTPQAAQAMTKGEIVLGSDDELGEAKNHMGETEYNTYFGWRVASRKAGAKSFTGDRDIDQGLDASGKAVSEWDGVSGSVFDDAHKKGAPEEVNEREEDRDEWDSNMPGYKGGFGKREREDDEGYARTKQADDAHNREIDRRSAELARAKRVPGPGAVNEALIGKGSQMAKYTHPDIEKKASGKNPPDSKYNTRLGRLNTKDDVKARQEKDKTKKVAESKMSELDIDLKDPKCSDMAFKKQYGKTKAEMRASFKKKPEAKKPVSKIKESILRESRDTMKHIINKFKNEVKRFVAGDEMDQDLYDALYDYYCDMGEMPYGTMKARTGDPYEWVANRFDRDVQDHEVPIDEEVRPELIPAVQRKQSGQNFPATLAQVGRNDSMSHLPNMQAKQKADPFGFGTKPLGGVQFESWTKELDTLLNEGMNITTNQGLEGPDSVTISATDADADQLLAAVRNAGLGIFGGDQGSDTMGQDGEVVTSEPGAEIDVVDDHDGMLSLIKKMTGQGDETAQSTEPESEEACQACESGSCDAHGEQVVDETDDGEEEDDPGAYESESEYRAAQKKASAKAGYYPEEGAEDDLDEAKDEDGEKAHDDDTNPFSDESDEEYDAKVAARSKKDEEEELDEAYANDADKTFETDIEFMQNVITGGLNGKKRTQSVGNPVTIASAPMKESVDLLSDYRKLSGL